MSKEIISVYARNHWQYHLYRYFFVFFFKKAFEFHTYVINVHRISSSFSRILELFRLYNFVRIKTNVELTI